MTETPNDNDRILYHIARSLLQERDYGDLLAQVLDLTINALHADRGCIVVREGDEFRATLARNFRNEALSECEQEISTTIANTTVQEGKIVNVRDASNAPGLKSKASVRRLQLRSVLCAPLIVRDLAFALIYLENRSVSNHFQDRDQQLLSEICALVAPRLHIALAIESARQKYQELASTYGESDGILTADEAMSRTLETLSKVAPTELPVLVQGETGTGKELFARALYRRSRRATGPFVVLNCAAIPSTLVESELFGWVRGAHNMADRDRVGLIGAANRGTLFLDEIGEMPLDVQSRFLRVLQTGDFNRLGSNRVEQVDIRIIAATNRDLETEIEQRRFREDLYFRLAGVVVKVPPLRERQIDIIMLANHFLRVYAGRHGTVAPRLSSECVELLRGYSFPGNIRELELAMAGLVVLSPPGEEIPTTALNDRIARCRSVRPKDYDPPVMSLFEMEKKLVTAVLRHTANNRTQAAEILGISREGLRSKMQKFGVGEAGTAED